MKDTPTPTAAALNFHQALGNTFPSSPPPSLLSPEPPLSLQEAARRVLKNEGSESAVGSEEEGAFCLNFWRGASEMVGYSYYCYSYYIFYFLFFIFYFLFFIFFHCLLLFILHSSFFILHSSFFILHSSFFIPHSSLFILHSSFFILHSSFFILHFSFFMISSF